MARLWEWGVEVSSIRFHENPFVGCLMCVDRVNLMSTPHGCKISIKKVDKP